MVVLYFRLQVYYQGLGEVFIFYSFVLELYLFIYLFAVSLNYIEDYSQENIDAFSPLPTPNYRLETVNKVVTH